MFSQYLCLIFSKFNWCIFYFWLCDNDKLVTFTIERLLGGVFIETYTFISLGWRDKSFKRKGKKIIAVHLKIADIFPFLTVTFFQTDSVNQMWWVLERFVLMELMFDLLGGLHFLGWPWEHRHGHDILWTSPTFGQQGNIWGYGLVRRSQSVW